MPSPAQPTYLLSWRPDGALGAWQTLGWGRAGGKVRNWWLGTSPPRPPFPSPPPPSPSLPPLPSPTSPIAHLSPLAPLPSSPTSPLPPPAPAGFQATSRQHPSGGQQRGRSWGSGPGPTLKPAPPAPKLAHLGTWVALLSGGAGLSLGTLQATKERHWKGLWRAGRGRHPLLWGPGPPLLASVLPVCLTPDASAQEADDG